MKEIDITEEEAQDILFAMARRLERLNRQINQGNKTLVQPRIDRAISIAEKMEFNYPDIVRSI